MASPRNVVSQSYPGAGGPEGPSWKTAEEMWTGTHMEKIKEEGSFVLILNRLEYLPRTWLLNCPSPYVVINLLEGGVVLQTLKSQQVDVAPRCVGTCVWHPHREVGFSSLAGGGGDRAPGGQEKGSIERTISQLL